MSNLHDEKREKLAADLEERISWYNRQATTHRWLHLALSSAIAAAGVLTSASGTKGLEGFWFVAPPAVFIWGLVATVGGVLNQVVNPGSKSESIQKTKIAVKALRINLLNGDLPVPEAARILTIALTDADRALQELERSIPRSAV
jgi:hypothetical protein